MASNLDKKIKEIVEMLDLLIQDTTIPKNVRKAIEKAKTNLLSQNNQDIAVKATSAIYIMDEISADTNLPIHARTHIWKIMSALESLKQK
ncbi:MAG: UPF0147 family protein [Candidatus Micrarchaeota archaeon]|nr:UPF0147 family protein [Candidatus Micrarchaeota archaeon]